MGIINSMILLAAIIVRIRTGRYLPG
jgi:hypothetical protein